MILSDGVMTAVLEIAGVLQLADETVNGHVLGMEMRMALANLDRLSNQFQVNLCSGCCKSKY